MWLEIRSSSRFGKKFAEPNILKSNKQLFLRDVYPVSKSYFPPNFLKKDKLLYISVNWSPQRVHRTFQPGVTWTYMQMACVPHINEAFEASGQPNLNYETIEPQWNRQYASPLNTSSLTPALLFLFATIYYE